MSRSLYPVRVSAAAEPAATPPSRSIHVNREIGTSNRNEAVSAAPNAVKTRRYQILGFVDRKSTRLNSSHANISYAVFCLKKKKISYSTTIHLTKNNNITLNPYNLALN